MQTRQLCLSLGDSQYSGQASGYQEPGSQSTRIMLYL